MSSGLLNLLKRLVEQFEKMKALFLRYCAKRTGLLPKIYRASDFSTALILLHIVGAHCCTLRW